MPRRKPCLDSLTPIRAEKPAEPITRALFNWADESVPVEVFDTGERTVRIVLMADCLTPDEAYRLGNALITCARLARKSNATP